MKERLPAPLCQSGHRMGARAWTRIQRARCGARSTRPRSFNTTPSACASTSLATSPADWKSVPSFEVDPGVLILEEADGQAPDVPLLAEIQDGVEVHAVEALPGAQPEIVTAAHALRTLHEAEFTPPLRLRVLLVFTLLPSTRHRRSTRRRQVPLAARGDMSCHRSASTLLGAGRE